VRGFLDWLYRASGALAAFFLVAICVIVLLQVGANLIDTVIAAAGGTPRGLLIPSYAEFAGFFLAASSFLALASTIRHGAHIRVLLVISRFSGRARRVLEIWCVAVGTAVSAYFAWYTLLLVGESFEYNDLSPGIVPVPLWIPQSAVALGLVILTIAFVDDLVRLLRRGDTSYIAVERAAE
jgi:TRAP-type C4-dicarboxylate transport system permease small subunit